MLKECIDIFNSFIKEKGVNVITDSCVLSNGTYVMVHKDMTYDEYIVYKSKVKKLHNEEYNNNEDNNNNQDNNNDEDIYGKLSLLDYYSKLIDMNKPVDKNKQIHSNNFLSFFVNKKSFAENKLSYGIIDDYYNTLANLEKKYKRDKNSFYLYCKAKEELGEIDIDRIEKHREFISNNIFNERWTEGKGYLKIFFDAPIEEYEREYKRYIIPNVFNNNKYNIDFGDEIIGISNFNITMNDNKPFLKSLTRKNILPNLMPINEAINIKMFADFLYNSASIGLTDVYLNNEGIRFFNTTDDFSGIYLKIKKGLETEIIHVDYITNFKDKIEGLEIVDLFNINYENIDTEKRAMRYGKIESLHELEEIISSVYFNGYLLRNYFTEVKDLDLNDYFVKNMIINHRQTFFTWFRHANHNNIKKIFDSISVKLIKNSIFKNSDFKACEQLNIYYSVNKYFKKEGDDMNVSELADIIDKKINIRGEETIEIESDDEFYFSLGQLLKFLTSLNRSSTKVNPFLKQFMSSNQEKMKDILSTLTIKYSFDKRTNYMNYKKLLSAVLEFVPDNNKKNEKIILAGYLYKSLIYVKIEKDNKDVNKNKRKA